MIEWEGKVLFTDAELMCPATGVVKLAPAFSDKLLVLRLELDRPMIVNSCCRSDQYNRALKNSHPRSLHVWDFPHHPTNGTAAIDIHIPNEQYRSELYQIAWVLEWSIGQSRNFMHLDRRVDYLEGYPQTEFSY